MSIVKLFSHENISSVATAPSGVALPTGPLVIAPGTYSFGGVNYDCTAEGLYTFWTPMATTQHKIVYASNVDQLMSSIAWLCVNGTADESLTVAQKTNAAVTSKLRMLCGSTIAWAKYLCDSMGIQSRMCRALTAATPTNYYDGHVLLEAMVNGAWKLYDIANGWTYSGKSLADTLPLTSATPSVTLAADGDYDAEPFVGGAFDVTAWQELTMLAPGSKRSEVERVLQIPGIVNTDGLTYFYMPSGTESRQSWLLALDASYRVITQSAWNAMFYPV